MPVEFALRPRIRLREDAPRPRRTRVRIPKYALPVAAYWLAMGGITYAFVHTRSAPTVSEESALAPEPSAHEDRRWWQRVPEAPAAESATPSPSPAPEPEPEPEPAPAIIAMNSPAPDPESTLEPAALPEPPREPASREPQERRDANRAANAPTAEPRSASASISPRATHALDPALSDPPAFGDSSGARTPLLPPSPPPTRNEPHNGGLPSCEAAMASQSQDMDFSRGNGTADLPTAAIAAVLENGAWLGSCDVPTSTSLDVCVAIQGGHVIGASVVSRPADARATACVRSRAAALQFPYSSHVDIARTRF